MIIWLTGNSGTGKTTIGKLIASRYDAILLDGDVMRSTISLGTGFSPEDREKHNLRVARLAQELDRQGFDIVVTVIAPFESTRRKIDKMISPVWIHLFKPSMQQDSNRPYETSNNYFISINTDNINIRQCYDIVMNSLKSIKGDNHGRWKP